MRVTLCIKTVDMPENKIRTKECATMKEAMDIWKKADLTLKDKITKAYIRKWDEWDYTIVKTLKA